MPSDLPYLASYKNVAKLFSKIQTAKVPDNFTTKYLSETLGLKSTTDRQLISILKTLGFLDPSGKPTTSYSALKNDQLAGLEIANAVRKAYSALFSANEMAHQLQPDELRGLISQVAGTDANMTTKVLGTFKSLVSVANFTKEAPPVKQGDDDTEGSDGEAPPQKGKGLRPEFHYNFQIHLPSNGTEETYINIFNAIRKVFK